MLKLDENERPNYHKLLRMFDGRKVQVNKICIEIIHNELKPNLNMVKKSLVKLNQDPITLSQDRINLLERE